MVEGSYPRPQSWKHCVIFPKDSNSVLSSTLWWQCWVSESKNLSQIPYSLRTWTKFIWCDILHVFLWMEITDCLQHLRKKGEKKVSHPFWSGLYMMHSSELKVVLTSFGTGGFAVTWSGSRPDWDEPYKCHREMYNNYYKRVTNERKISDPFLP